jgi:hypothetical protein
MLASSIAVKQYSVIFVTTCQIIFPGFGENKDALIPILGIACN